MALGDLFSPRKEPHGLGVWRLSLLLWALTPLSWLKLYDLSAHQRLPLRSTQSIRMCVRTCTRTMSYSTPWQLGMVRSCTKSSGIFTGGCVIIYSGRITCLNWWDLFFFSLKSVWVCIWWLTAFTKSCCGTHLVNMCLRGVSLHDTQTHTRTH